MKQFMDKDFLLSTDMAKTLYHDFAETMPILDYHCHINPQEIYEDRKFDNITQVWLGGDHYKWRQMRSNGVDEKYVTGDATDREKFQAWAETMPKLIGNPLYHWSHLELRNAKAHRKPVISLEPSGAEKILRLSGILKRRYRRGGMEPVQRKAAGGFHDCAQPDQAV